MVMTSGCAKLSSDFVCTWAGEMASFATLSLFYYYLWKPPSCVPVSSCSWVCMCILSPRNIYRVIGAQLRSKTLPLRLAGIKGERVCSSYSLLTSVLDGGEWSTSLPGRALASGKGPPGTHCTGGWVGLRAVLQRLEEKSFCRESGRSVCSQTLYLLSYPHARSSRRK
jgi:hypothetical protein